MKKQLLIASVIFVAAQMVFCQEAPEQIFQTFLYGKTTEQAEKSYRYIYKNQNKFSDLVFNELVKYKDTKKHITIPDRLIYLATIIREKRYIKPLIKLISDSSYSNNACIYSCPVVFSLCLYACYTKYVVPIDLDTSVWAVKDLYRDIALEKSISLEDHRQRRAWEEEFICANLPDTSIMVLSVNNLLIKAGPGHDFNTRYSAVDELADRDIPRKYLPQLFSLLMTEPTNDASCEYRGLVYEAILRTEQAAAQIRKKK